MAALMLVISTPGSARIFGGLAGACRRRGVDWDCFFTNDGVRVLADPALAALAAGAGRAVACEHSWSRHMSGAPCPVRLGSQTDHSAMIGAAARVVSL